MTGGSTRDLNPSVTAGVPSRMRPPPAPNELRIPPARQAKASSSSARGTPSGRPGRGAPDVGGRQGGRGGLLRTPSTLQSPPASQQSESLLSDDEPADSQDSATMYDASQVGVAGLFTRMARDFDARLDNMREAFQETLSDRIIGVTTTVSNTLRTQTAELTDTLTEIRTQTTALTATLTGLNASFSGHVAANTAALADIRSSLRDISDTNRDTTLILARLKQDILGTPRDNVIPPEPDFVVHTSAIPVNPAGLATSTPDGDDTTSSADQPPAAFAAPAGLTTTTPDGDGISATTDGPSEAAEIATAPDHLIPGRLGTALNPIDVTANSALANLDRDRYQSDAARATATWRNTHESRASSAAQPRPPGDIPRARGALGATVQPYTQTRLPDIYPSRPTLIATDTDDGHFATHSPPYPPQFDTVTDARTWNGGMIESPRYIDRRRQAVERRVHPSNIEVLAAPEYHGGELGKPAIDMPFVHSCGYRSSISGTDVVTAYGEIILLHASTIERWENTRTHQYGPQLERIIEKGLTTLPRLHGLAMEEIIEFYDKLQPISALYLLPIVPFDCINVSMGYEALCPPGLGTRRYGTIGRVLIEVLPRILPKLNSQVNTIVTMVRQESNNGYDLLWRILELGVPGFDPSVPIRVPVWKDDDVFEFATAFCLYYRLLAKKGVQYDDRSKSITFLQAITAPAYVDAASTILINVHNFYSSEFDASLPPALCIMGIANQLNDQAVKRAAAILPRVRRLASAQDDDYDFPPDYPSASRMDGNRRWPDRPAYGDRQRGYRDDARYDKNDRGGDRQDRGGDGGNRSGRGAPRPPVQGSRGPARQPFPRGRYVRPDRNRGAYLPEIICDACRRPGHVAATCDVLAMALFIEKYKRDMSSDLKDKLERDWVSRWKDTVGSNKPRRVMKTYVDHLDISVDDLDDLLCWDCWPDEDPESEPAFDDPTGSA